MRKHTEPAGSGSPVCCKWDSFITDGRSGGTKVKAAGAAWGMYQKTQTYSHIAANLADLTQFTVILNSNLWFYSFIFYFFFEFLYSVKRFEETWVGIEQYK